MIEYGPGGGGGVVDSFCEIVVPKRLSIHDDDDTSP